MIYDIKKIQKEASKDFFSEWEKTNNLFPQDTSPGFDDKVLKPGKPEPHPMHNIIQKIRSNFLRLGFTEVENPIFVEEQDVYKQYGPEAPAILDRCYYLAGLPRPEIGLSESKIGAIKKQVPSFDSKKAELLKQILRDYKLGRIEGDDFMDEISEKLKIGDDSAAKIIDQFSELKNLKAEPGSMTLRSHMTAAWFPTLEALQDKMEFPLKLFCIGLRFRREQKIDATHLRAHYGASCVVCDENMNLKTGEALAEEVLKPLGFKEFEYENKKTTSTYYANKSEYEIYAKSGDKRVEIADMGMYSPIALANYGVKYPTFNIGFGLERILMILQGWEDVRSLLYPQFYLEKPLLDEEIAKQVSINKKPQTAEGAKLAAAIEKTAREHADAASPCEFLAYKGPLSGKDIELYVTEPEEGTMLLGPAALNDILVYDGGIYGVPKDLSQLKEKAKEIREKGLDVGISYIEAAANLFAAEAEQAAAEGKSYKDSIKMSKTAPDINIKIGNSASKFIQSKKKEIRLKGPVFTSVEMKI